MRVCDVFVKLGGSVLDHDDWTAELVPYITELAGTQRILMLTGGGRTAKRIKANQRTLGGDTFYGCWRAGVLCLEVNANLLASYSAAFAVVSSLAEMSACFEAGKIGVFSPTGALLSSLHLTPDWNVTTDSIGLYFASTLGARRYVIISDVDGIYESKPEEGTRRSPIPQLSANEIERLPSSKLDPSFSAYFRRHALPTVVVNGRYPHRVSAAIRGEPTLCTQVVARASNEAP